MRKLLLIMVSLFALGMIATACGGDDPTPAASGVTAQDIQEAVDRAVTGAADGQTTPGEIQTLIEAAITAAAAGPSEGLTAAQVEAI